MAGEFELLSNVPADAQSAEELSLPVDAAERKRVLNILAQRRYRRRRRERQVALENLVFRPNDTTNKNQQDWRQQNSLQRNISASSTSSDSSPSSGGSAAVPELAWSTRDEPIWPAEPVDFNNDISLSDNSWTSPERVITELNEFLQADDILNATFADDLQIEVPELDLLRAAYEIAGRMQSARLLFDMNAESVFLTSDCSSWLAALPKNLQPTTLQLTISHHPILDILPWPSVRNRLINMYSLPSDLWPRHPNDGSESSLMRMVYDMENGGIRLRGSDPSKEEAWELEQVFFDAWWWAMDQRVVNLSNRKRLERGLPRLSVR